MSKYRLQSGCHSFDAFASHAPIVFLLHPTQAGVKQAKAGIPFAPGPFRPIVLRQVAGTHIIFIQMGKNAFVTKG
jgi:hypothetical protein